MPLRTVRRAKSGLLVVSDFPLLLLFVLVPLEAGEPCDDVAEFFAGQRVREAGWHGSAIVNSLFDCIGGNLTNFSSGEVAEAHRAGIF